MKLKQMGDMVWCEDQAEGAILNGSSVEKQNSEEGDLKVNGTIGTVVGSIKNPKENQSEENRFAQFIYWVKWSATGAPIFIVDWKLKEIKK